MDGVFLMGWRSVFWSSGISVSSLMIWSNEWRALILLVLVGMGGTLYGGSVGLYARADSDDWWFCVGAVWGWTEFDQPDPY